MDNTHDALKELAGLAADVNVNEIADHIRHGTLAQWVESWQMQMALELENARLSAAELEKLRRENFGLKTTVNNLRSKVEKFYNHR